MNCIQLTWGIDGVSTSILKYYLLRYEGVYFILKSDTPRLPCLAHSRYKLRICIFPFVCYIGMYMYITPHTLVYIDARLLHFK